MACSGEGIHVVERPHHPGGGGSRDERLEFPNPIDPVEVDHVGIRNPAESGRFCPIADEADGRTKRGRFDDVLVECRCDGVRR